MPVVFVCEKTKNLLNEVRSKVWLDKKIYLKSYDKIIYYLAEWWLNERSIGKTNKQKS